MADNPNSPQPAKQLEKKPVAAEKRPAEQEEKIKGGVKFTPATPAKVEEIIGRT